MNEIFEVQLIMKHWPVIWDSPPCGDILHQPINSTVVLQYYGKEHATRLFACHCQIKLLNSRKMLKH